MKRSSAPILIFTLVSSGAFAQGGSLADRYQRSLQQLDATRATEAVTRAKRDRINERAKDLQNRLVANAARSPRDRMPPSSRPSETSTC